MATSGSVSTSKYDGRYYTVSWTATQSVANNQSKVKWTLKAVGGESSWYAERTLKVVLGGSTVFSKTDRVERKAGTIASGTKVIKHDSSGDASFSISIQAAVYVSSINCTGSKTFTLANIPRKSTLSVSSGTLGIEQNLTVTKKSSSFTHTIKAVCSSDTMTICTKSSSTSIAFTLPVSWSTHNQSGTAVSVAFIITTYSGSDSIGSNTYASIYKIPSSVKPSCSISVTDPTGYYDKYGVYLKLLSKFKVVITPTTSYGSDIVSYSSTANGANYTASSFTTNVIKTSGSLSISSTVKDERGRTGSASASKTVLDYAFPAIKSLKVGRCDSDGTANGQGEYVKVTFSSKLTNINNKNAATYILYYKKGSASQYTQVTLSDYANNFAVSGGSYIFAAETGSSYDVKLTASDGIKTATLNTSASTAFTLMHFSKGGTGLGIGKVAENENLMDVDMPVRFRNGVYSSLLWSGALYMSASHEITLLEAVSKQPNGIVLVFSHYDGTSAQNYNFSSHFVHKSLVAKHPSGGSMFLMMNANFSSVGSKYLYISDTKISGNDNNASSGTNNGITYNNRNFVLRYVFGV